MFTSVPILEPYLLLIMGTSPNSRLRNFPTQPFHIKKSKKFKLKVISKPRISYSEYGQRKYHYLRSQFENWHLCFQNQKYLSLLKGNKTWQKFRKRSGKSKYFWQWLKTYNCSFLLAPVSLFPLSIVSVLKDVFKKFVYNFILYNDG